MAFDVKSLVMQTHLSLHIKFADRAVWTATKGIMPSVRSIAHEKHAPLTPAVRLSSVPVGVGHCRHCRGRVERSPDECGITIRVNTLSSRPEIISASAINGLIASTARRL